MAKKLKNCETCVLGKNDNESDFCVSCKTGIWENWTDILPSSKPRTAHELNKEWINSPLVKSSPHGEYKSVDHATYKKAIDKFGVNAQMGIVQEECAELIVAISKDLRYASKETHNNLVEEIADVEIMLEQLKLIFDCHDIIKTVKQQKIERLKGLVENG